MKGKPCRHRDTWLIAGGYYEWCYRCGAFRRHAEYKPGRFWPATTFLRPVGPTAPNPALTDWHHGKGLRRRKRADDAD